jgi:hypothetical protein
MKEHFCSAEKSMITYEGSCNWCGESEGSMTQDEIIEMARHIADTFGTRMCDENNDTHGEELYAMGMDDIAETIKLVAAKEREACAKVADEYMRDCEGKSFGVGTAIRARGEQA